MPTILPEPGPVQWPAHEGAIGVVGVAPWATVDFCRAVYSLVPAEKDWHYPRLIIDANSKIPSRGRHLQLGERDPSPFIRATIGELVQQGASVVVVPCNTAHIMYERWAAGAAVPVPHIVEVTTAAAVSTGARRVAVLASDASQSNALYTDALRAKNIEPVLGSSQVRARVRVLIDAVKREGPDGHRAAELREVLHCVQRDEGAELAILGCTELSAVRASGAAGTWPIRTVDSNEELARASLRAIGITTHT